MRAQNDSIIREVIRAEMGERINYLPVDEGADALLTVWKPIANGFLPQVSKASTRALWHRRGDEWSQARAGDILRMANIWAWCRRTHSRRQVSHAVAGPEQVNTP